MKNYKELLVQYISSVDATTGAIVYQPCNGLLDVCQSEETRQMLLTQVQTSEITVYEQRVGSVYQDLVNWSKESDLLLESSNGILFCIPKAI